MISLSTLSYGQFKVLCEEIGIDKVLEFSKKINLLGGQTKSSKKYRPALTLVYKKAYSAALNSFVNEELKKIGYLSLEQYYSHKYPNTQNMIIETDISENEKATYLSEIIATLKELGGTGHLSEINAKILERNKLPYIKTNSNWQRQVSNSLQSHCKETQTFKEGNKELFYSVNGIGKGVWGLIGYKTDKSDETIDSLTVTEKDNTYTKKISFRKST